MLLVLSSHIRTRGLFMLISWVVVLTTASERCSTYEPSPGYEIGVLYALLFALYNFCPNARNATLALPTSWTASCSIFHFSESISSSLGACPNARPKTRSNSFKTSSAMDISLNDARHWVEVFHQLGPKPPCIPDLRPRSRPGAR